MAQHQLHITQQLPSLPPARIVESLKLKLSLDEGMNGSTNKKYGVTARIGAER